LATEDAFRERIISTIREEVSKSNPFGGLLQLVQTPSAPTPTKSENTETEETVMDFMDNF
jgi:hypothetical protein